ncbi:MAG TPA: RraA family protein [Terriglobales bacterium]|jgi:4-hydroxy-4-methyl-2-oxoglutarate aldolase|nr:RraA family protein [Terriglobales bacterium]
MTISTEVIRQLAEFDAATLYEAAGQRGMVDPSIKPVWLGAKVCGPAVTVSCPARDNLMLHHAVAIAEPGSVLVASAERYQYAGAWGEVLSVAAQARGIAGLVIDGAVRDMEAITERRFPVFSRGLAIGACKKEQIGTLQEPIDLGGVIVRSGDIVVGTGDGVVVLDVATIEQVLRSAIARRERESEIFRQLQAGKTTIEILNLPRWNRPGGTV